MIKLIDSGDLSFRELASANEKRVVQYRNGAGELVHGFLGVVTWSISDWTNALAGEVGEACNLSKKLMRGDFDSGEAHDAAVKKLGHELADVVTYADLCAQRLGLSLGDLVREKFNIVSDRVGSDEKL